MKQFVRTLSLVLAFAAPGASVLVGCSGETSTVAVGTLGAPCYPNQTCNGPLRCLNNLCVAGAADGGPAADGATIRDGAPADGMPPRDGPQIFSDGKLLVDGPRPDQGRDSAVLPADGALDGSVSDGPIHLPKGKFQVVSHYAYAQVGRLWAASANDYWATARAGFLLHYDGVSWEPVQLPTSQKINAIWGAAANNIWAVGNSGTMLHYDGSSWAVAQQSVVPTGANMTDVRGTSANDVWASSSSSSASVVHFDGIVWKLSGGLWTGTWRLYPMAANNVWAFTDSATSPWLRFFDGIGWNVSSGTPPTPALAVWGAPPSQLLIASALGRVHSFDGSKWTTDLSVIGNNAGREIWAPSAASLKGAWIVGDRNDGAVFDGTSWKHLPPESSPTGAELRLDGIAGSSASDVWAVGPGVRDGFFYHFDGSKWTKQVEAGYESWYAAIWADTKDSAWAVGGLRGNIMRCSAYRCRIAVPSTATSNRLRGVWGHAANHAWAVGLRFMAYDGSSWTAHSTPQSTDELYAVWGDAPDSYWAVGRNSSSQGIIYRYNTLTKAWESQSNIPPTRFLSAIWGTSASDIWAAGESSTAGNGVVLHYDGTLWTRVLGVPQTEVLRAVHAGGATDVWVAGEKGTILHYDGSNWTNFAGPNSSDSIVRIHREGTDLIAITQRTVGSAMWWHDGTSWKQLHEGPDTLFGYARTGGVDWIGGTQSLIARSR
ncbi:MAG: hypothetical protein H6707_13320 [Deltaproteobacteria bacterium]|nr:hypothetical protein [Deltaproteobacteria bacterium]